MSELTTESSTRGNVVVAAATALWAFLRSSKLGMLSTFFLLLALISALCAELIAPFDPVRGHYDSIRVAPSLNTYYLGTDDYGRDVLSRLIFGARISLLVGISATLLGDFFGLFWGVLSGYLGRTFDLVSQRALDILMAFPNLILAMLIMVSIGPGITTVIIAVAVGRIPATTRIIRSVVLSVKETAYVDSAHAIGASSARIMSKHVLPQCIAPFLVLLSVHIGISIIAESSLSYLGIGIPPPNASWGNMLGEATSGRFKPDWWLAVVPGLAITLIVLSSNLMGDALRDFLDPRLRGRLEE